MGLAKNGQSQGGSGGGGFANPMTTAEDLIKGGAAGAAARVGVGGNGQVLTVTAGVVGWANSAAGFANPMTTSQDLIVGGVAGAAGRLAVGGNGTVLTVTGGSVGWAAPATVSVLTSGANTLTIDSNGHLIKAGQAGSTTVAAGATLGAGGTVSIAGDDTRGVITMNTGTGANAGALAVVTFAQAYASTPTVVGIRGDQLATNAGFGAVAPSTTGFTVQSFLAPTSSLSGYKFNYFVLQ